MTFYRVKLRAKTGAGPASDEERRRAVRELIAKHGGKDASPHRPRAFVVGVFRDRKAARTFRDEARERLKNEA